MLATRGYVLEGWDKVDPYHLLGAKPAEQLPPSAVGQGTLSSVTASQMDSGAKPWHPDSPLFWFGVVAGVTLGLIGASTAVRVGPFKASIGAGTT